MYYENKMGQCCLFSLKVCADIWHWSEKQILGKTVVSTFKVLTGGCSSFCPECIFPDRLRESDSVRINLRRCSVAASLSQWLTEPVTFGRVWDYWCFICALVAHLWLLRLSYVKMRDCQEKPQGCDNNLSISPFFLPLPRSFYFNLSVCLSSPPLWLFMLTFWFPMPTSLPVALPLFHQLISLSLTYSVSALPLYLFPTFPLQVSSQFWCRFSGTQALWSVQIIL